eukprot:3842648-Rhodomonas_salina.1
MGIFFCCCFCYQQQRATHKLNYLSAYMRNHLQEQEQERGGERARPRLQDQKEERARQGGERERERARAATFGVPRLAEHVMLLQLVTRRLALICRKSSEINQNTRNLRALCARNTCFAFGVGQGTGRCLSLGHAA